MGRRSRVDQQGTPSLENYELTYPCYSDCDCCQKKTGRGYGAKFEFTFISWASYRVVEHEEGQIDLPQLFWTVC